MCALWPNRASHTNNELVPERRIESQPLLLLRAQDHQVGSSRERVCGNTRLRGVV